MRVIPFTLIFLSLTACSAAQTISKCGDWPIPEPPASSPLQQSFSSAQGGFRIGLPPREADKPESYDGPVGHIETTRFKWFVLNRGQYEISYSDYDKILENQTDSKKILDNLRDLLLSKVPGHLEVDSVLTINGHPGREIRIRDDKGIDIQRFYLVGQRMYEVSAFVPITLECGLDSVIKVLDSFALLER